MLLPTLWDSSGKVSICEINESAASIAEEYAEQSIVGDCENLEWTKKLVMRKFHYIVFTDVLEHLRDPGKILEEARSFLEPGGKVLTSIPNISYKTVLIDLIKYDNFEYSASGILDSTHLRFFTEKTVRTLFESNNYQIDHIYHYKGAVMKNEKQLTEFPFFVRWYLDRRNKNINTSVFFIEAGEFNS